VYPSSTACSSIGTMTHPHFSANPKILELSAFSLVTMVVVE
jgi:hypothetical protein